MFHRALAADAAAVGILFVAGAHALDHDHPLPLGRFRRAPCRKPAQFQLGHDPVVLAVGELLGLVFVGAGGHDGDPVVDLALVHAGPHQHFRGEVAFVAAEADHQGLGQHLDLVVGLDLLDELVQVGAAPPRLRWCGESCGPCRPARSSFSRRMVSNPWSARFRAAFRPATPPPITRARWLMSGAFPSAASRGRPGHRHAHQVFGLVRGRLRLLHVHPGILVRGCWPSRRGTC